MPHPSSFTCAKKFCRLPPSYNSLERISSRDSPKRWKEEELEEAIRQSRKGRGGDRKTYLRRREKEDFGITWAFFLSSRVRERS